VYFVPPTVTRKLSVSFFHCAASVAPNCGYFTVFLVLLLARHSAIVLPHNRSTNHF
jgi:hypothetical protein